MVGGRNCILVACSSAYSWILNADVRHGKEMEYRK